MEMGRARLRLEGMLQAYVEKSRIAEEHRNKEHGAVILLQCAWRRKMVYIMLQRWNCAATNIQRTYRGHLGRERFLFVLRTRDKALRMAYFNYRATIIQRIYRGYYSRKYVHSYYARKEFLLGAMARGTEVKKDILSSYKEQVTLTCEAAARRTENDIDKFMELNHCYLGTRCIKGIYYSDYLSVLGEPNQIEEKIRESKKQRDCIEAVRRSKLAKKPPSPELWRYKYLTTVGPYITKLDVRREEEKKNKLLQYAQEDFRTYLRDRTNLFKGKTIRAESEYGSRPPPKDDKRWQKIAKKRFFVNVPRRRRFSCGGK